MRVHLVGATALLFTACAAEPPAALLVHIDADLEIGREVNELLVQTRADGAVVDDVTYPLGAGDAAAWPQVLPVVEGALHPTQLIMRFEAALRTEAGRVVMGATEVQAFFPVEGTQSAFVYLPRACDDFDKDGFGVGYGCDEPDCDDFDPRVPLLEACAREGPACSQESDCEGIHLACLDHREECVCRLPCFVPAECRGLRCVDGCCQI